MILMEVFVNCVIDVTSRVNSAIFGLVMESYV